MLFRQAGRPTREISINFRIGILREIPIYDRLMHKGGWILNYRKQPPDKPGLYAWDVCHRLGLKIKFTAKYQWRMAGCRRVLSPAFEYWDGYRLLLPQGTILWEKTDETKEFKILNIQDIENKPCPFCGKVPEWGYGGRFISASPLDSEYFYLVCCGYFNGFLNRHRDPRAIATWRNTALRRTAMCANVANC